ncbi:MAG: VCBS domain-containing protein [Microvirga sp.]
MALGILSTDRSGDLPTNQYVSAVLVGDFKWNTALTTFTDNTIRYYIGPSAVLSQGELNLFEGAVATALASWANVADINIVRAPDPSDAEIVVQLVGEDRLAGDVTSANGISGGPFHAGIPAGYTNPQHNILLAEYGQVHTYVTRFEFFDEFNGLPQGVTSRGLGTLVHELGHALGLKHPHDFGPDNNAVVFPGVSGQNDAGDNGLNDRVYTVMSYNGTRSSAPGAFDVAALQHLYGARTDFAGGDNFYALSDPDIDPDPNNPDAWEGAIWDTGGIDTIIYHGSARAVIDLRPATLDNSPTGGGMPSYTVGAGGAIGRGYTIAADFTNAIADRGSVTGVIIENATGGSGNDTITGNDTDNVLKGEIGEDTLYGYDGNDTLDGGSGADTMYGMGGDDTYYVSQIGDVASETVSINGTLYNAGGYDTIITLFDSYTLTNDPFSEIENLTHLGPIAFFGAGNDLGNRITSGSGADWLEGRGGNDILDGGDGIDVLVGGQGDDDYYATAGDVIIEDQARSLGGGSDTVYISTSYTLGENVENLTNTGSFRFFGTGNELANALTGGVGPNNFFGLGGKDLLIGGAVTDILEGGDQDDTLIGNGGSDILLGGNDNDKLIGGGDDDTLTGGAGADTFVYTVGGGTDTITDFEVGVDKIDVVSVGGKYKLSDLTITQNGANTIITLGSGFILQNVQMSTLTASSFIFTNLGPVAPATNVVVTNEDTASASIAIGATDANDDVLIYSLKSGFGPSAGGVAFAGGGFVYTPNANVNGSDSFTIVINDGHGGTTEQVVSVTVNAVADAAVIGGVTTGAVKEDGPLTASGVLTIVDPDAGEGGFRAGAYAGAYGNLALTSAGAWTYTLNNAHAAVQGLNAGQTLPDSIVVKAADGTTKTISFTIQGTDETFTGNDRSNVLTGTNGNDLIDGRGAEDVLNGGAGNDTLIGGGDSDLALGGAGDDRFVATLRDGNDIYWGGSGSDTLDFSNMLAKVTVDLGLLGFASGSEIGRDLVFEIENVTGGQGGDSISGDSAANVLDGGGGSDKIDAGGGNDTVRGGSGNDTLNGEWGNDVLTGGAGNDVMDGGSGNDIFVFAAGFGNDRITGFDAAPAGGQDLLDVTAFGLTAADFGPGHRVVISDVGSDTLITIDGGSSIRLVGIGNATTVTHADFLL